MEALVGKLVDSLMHEDDGISKQSYRLLATLVRAVGLPVTSLFNLTEVMDDRFFFEEDDDSFADDLSLSEDVALIDLPLIEIDVEGVN